MFIGEPLIVGEDAQVTIDCGPLIDEAINNGTANPTITWYRNGLEFFNGSAANVLVTVDRRLCIISGTTVSACWRFAWK